jgi:hypothetical protein
MRKRFLRRVILLAAPIVWRRVQRRMYRRGRGHGGHRGRGYIHWGGREARYGNRGRSRFWL